MPYPHREREKDGERTEEREIERAEGEESRERGEIIGLFLVVICRERDRREQKEMRHTEEREGRKERLRGIE